MGNLSFRSRCDLIIWNVQHGSAAYLKTSSARHAVFDLGTGTHANPILTFSPLQHLQKYYNVSKLDLAVISHPHADHIGDVYELLRMAPSKVVYPSHLSEQDIMGGNKQGDQNLLRLYQCVISRLIQNRYPRFLQSLLPNNVDYDDAKITWWSPRSCAASNLNNHSIVVLIECGNIKVLIPGDNEECAWNELLSNSEFTKMAGDVDILLAPHHGRQSAYCSALMDLVSPKLTVISDCYKSNSSAVGLYSSRSTGMNVVSRSRGAESRYCVTTRKDGVITVRISKERLFSPYKLDVSVN